MRRLIDANEALRMIGNSKIDNNFLDILCYRTWDLAHDAAKSCVETCDTVDAVEVVRCKDCEMEYGCRVAQWLGENGFCSYGERKDGDGNG